MSPTDHAEAINGDDDLHRRLAPNCVQEGKVLSVAYKTRGEPDPEVSVDIARLTTPEEVLKNKPGFGLGSLKAAVPLALGLEVRHDPLPDNYAHALIFNTGDKSRRKEMCRRLADATTIQIPPKPRD